MSSVLGFEPLKLVPTSNLFNTNAIQRTPRKALEAVSANTRKAKILAEPVIFPIVKNQRQQPDLPWRRFPGERVDGSMSIPKMRVRGRFSSILRGRGIVWDPPGRIKSRPHSTGPTILSIYV